MPDWLLWFTHLENSKVFSLLWFMVAFLAIVIYVFTGKKRARRLESYKDIPFQDEAGASPSRKVTDDERSQE